MLDEHVKLLEASFVKEHGNSFTCRELAFLVLRIYPFLAAAHAGLGSALNQFFNLFLLDTHNNIRICYVS